MKKALLIVVLFLLGIAAVLAQESHDNEIEEGKKLVESEMSCDELSDEQLEKIGDYYMEQMHPGEQHELMDNMMGGEGSASLKQMHINMAKRLYCDEDIYIGYGMMNSGGMMNMMSGGMMGSGMLGTWGYGFGYWNVVNILYVLLLLGIIILLYFWIFRLWKSMKKKSR